MMTEAGGRAPYCCNMRNMSEYEFTISLRIRHPEIEPARITDVLGLQPQHSWKAGEPRRTPAGDDCAGEYRDSYWMVRLMDAPQLSTTEVSVESVLVQIITQLRRAVAFLEQLRSEGGTSELSISLFARENFQLELSPDTMALLARMGLAVQLDIQPHTRFDAATPRSN